MDKNTYFSNRTGLYDPEYEHDACGVGFIAHLKGEKSHEIIRDGLKILENLSHRGASGSDPETGDGAGILIQMPDELIRSECNIRNIDLPQPGDYGVGLVFLPTLKEERHIVEHIIEHVVREEGEEFLGFRDVPYDDSKIGRIARSVMPVMKHLIIGRGAKTNREDFERKLLIIRKKLGLKIRITELVQKKYFYICSLSSKVLVYKGQLKADQLDRFFPDLASSTLKSAIALVHSRYSTNTFPTWALAHPFRMIAHNGEINTIKGNKNWFNTREKYFWSDIFGNDLEKIFPVIAPSKSDSAAFDNALEMLVAAGRSLPHAIMMMIPEAFTYDKNIDEDKKAFYEYHSCLMEPWDGPATISFTDGRYIGSVLDRNGLRPSRFCVTKDDRVIMASETGALLVDESSIVQKGRLQPGKIFLVDTEEGRIIEDEEIKENIIHRKPYKNWLKENLLHINDLEKVDKQESQNEKELLKLQKAFGYTEEDINLIMLPMVSDGAEAIGSMGADTPLAVLSEKPQLLFNYFHQLFAQVTNPPIDPIREKIVMSGHMYLGPEQNLLNETPKHCRRLKLDLPILTNSQLKSIKNLEDEVLRVKELSILYSAKDGEKGLKKALKRLFKRADKAIEYGYSILILSDKGLDENTVAIPSLLACSGLHHHLIKKGTRTKVSIVMETGEARELHHFAVLIGYGANAINPYLAFETIQQLHQNGKIKGELSYKQAEANYVKSIEKGLYKIISKMGISTIQSYCGAQIFEAVGISSKVIDKYFTGTSSRIGGIGLKIIAKEQLLRHKAAFKPEQGDDPNLDLGGRYKWRKNGEFHQWNPDTIALLQHAVRSNNYSIYKEYAEKVNNPKYNSATIRSLLSFRKRRPIPIEEVEQISEIVKRFATGAMSYGSISKEAHETLALAMNKLGGYSNTGEGGEERERFKILPDGSSKRSRIKQIAQGRFGVSIEYLVNADQLQIKMAQGAKPGEGGQLPGHKVSKEIASTRHTTRGVGLISPPPHHDIYSIEDLSQLIFDLKNSNPGADISVKLVSEIGVGTIAAGVAKGKADHILISGYEGGTGASPQTSIKYTGLPLELGLAETQQVLVMNELRNRVRVQADGQLKTGKDVVIAALLGADEFGFATSALISMGCIMMRKCHLNTCSVGVATQNPELRKNFKGEPEHVINFFSFVAQEVREIMALLGVRKLDQLIGHADYLVMRDDIKHWKAKYLDLTNILYVPDIPVRFPFYNTEKQEHQIDDVLDVKLIQTAKKAIYEKIPSRFSCEIKNTDRTVGAMLSSVIAKKYGLTGLPDDTIHVDFEGTAGQSFGAFLSKGITFRLEGDANDYVGKGLSGGKIIIVPHPTAEFVPEENIIAGNVVLYGAINGELFIRGKAGERFAVRNSGATAVVEGVGDHGCEYMTGGKVVILGDVGRNFAAGMSGGLAFVYDDSGSFRSLCNSEMVDLYDLVEEKDIIDIRQLIENHLHFTGSKVAERILSNWNDSVKKFVKVFPKDLQRVMAETEIRQIVETSV